MRLAISNIAWLDHEDDAVAAVCKRVGLGAVEVAPGRLSPQPLEMTSEQVRDAVAYWDGKGLPITSMQALLFGRSDLQLFGEDQGDAMVDYLRQVFGLAGALGAGPAVFGSPGNRRRGDLPVSSAVLHASRVFRDLGEAATVDGVTLCLEPNAVAYGCDFMTNLAETAAVVREVDHPGVGLIVDTGNMQMAGDSADDIASVADVIRHVHVSRPNLLPVDDTDSFLPDVILAVVDSGYSGQITIEMRRSEDDPIGSIERACETVASWIVAP